MGPLEEAIRTKFIPALLAEESPVSDDRRKLLALPARYAGLGIENPVDAAAHKLEDSKQLTAKLQELLITSAHEFPDEEHDTQATASTISARREKRFKDEISDLKSRAPVEVQRAIDLAREKGASAVFSCLPLERYGFAFKSKRDYVDLLRMRYRMRLRGLPRSCACGESYSLDHSQMCRLGGFIHMRHDEPKNLFASLASQVYRDVQVEPPLAPLSGEELRQGAKVGEDVRSDVRVRGFWSPHRDAFFEFRVSYPFAVTYENRKPHKLCEHLSKMRKREYEQRVREVDGADFTPMVMLSTGSVGAEMDVAIKSLASKLAMKREEAYSHVCGLVRCSFAFALARSALVCLRGTRSRHVHVLDPFRFRADVAMHELEMHV